MIELEGSRLKTARRRRGLTHEELSKATGIGAGMLQDWEDCNAWCNSQEAINNLALALKFPPGFFVGPEIEILEPWQVNMCRIDYDSLIVCDACNEPITGDDLHDRHEGHRDGCSNRDKPDSTDCDCDIAYHERCCPECNGTQS